jgi:hypothetical protein
MVLFLLFLWLLGVVKRKIIVNITKKEIVSTFETISFRFISVLSGKLYKLSFVRDLANADFQFSLRSK